MTGGRSAPGGPAGRPTARRGGAGMTEDTGRGGPDPDGPTAALEEQLRRLTASQRRQRRLLEAVVAISADMDTHTMLQHIVTVGTELFDARSGALGVLGDDGTVADLITVGADERQGGAPPGHPADREVLGVPLTVRGTVYGNLCVVRQEGRHTLHGRRREAADRAGQRRERQHRERQALRAAQVHHRAVPAPHAARPARPRADRGTGALPAGLRAAQAAAADSVRRPGPARRVHVHHRGRRDRARPRGRAGHGAVPQHASRPGTRPGRSARGDRLRAGRGRRRPSTTRRPPPWCWAASKSAVRGSTPSTGPTPGTRRRC